jgi:hypothetical protein
MCGHESGWMGWCTLKEEDVMRCILAPADAQSMPAALSDESDGSGRGSSESQHQNSERLPEVPGAGNERMMRQASAPPGLSFRARDISILQGTAPSS